MGRLTTDEPRWVVIEPRLETPVYVRMQNWYDARFAASAHLGIPQERVQLVAVEWSAVIALYIKRVDIIAWDDSKLVVEHVSKNVRGA